MYILVFLLSIFVLTTYTVAFEIEREERSVTITNSNPQVELHLIKEDNCLKLYLVTVDRTVTLFKSIDSAQMKCISNSTGEVAALSEKEYKIVSLLLSKIKSLSLNKEYTKFLYRGLNLLEAWPPGMPVRITIRPEETTYQTPDGIEHQSTTKGFAVPPGKILEPVPSPYSSLCSYQG